MMIKNMMDRLWQPGVYIYFSAGLNPVMEIIQMGFIFLPENVIGDYV
jgi:hypothetical protein